MRPGVILYYYTNTATDPGRIVFDHIDSRSPVPLYAQIAERVRLAIAAAELRVGDALPSVRQLATRLRVNPATIVQAYRELEGGGFVETRHGAGTFVRDVRPGLREAERASAARRLARALLDEGARLGIAPRELLVALQAEAAR